jgi:hypothetical protein
LESENLSANSRGRWAKSPAILAGILALLWLGLFVAHVMASTSELGSGQSSLWSVWWRGLLMVGLGGVLSSAIALGVARPVRRPPEELDIVSVERRMAEASRSEISGYVNSEGATVAEALKDWVQGRIPS